MPGPISAKCRECGGTLLHDARLGLDTNAFCVDCDHRVKV